MKDLSKMHKKQAVLKVLFKAAKLYQDNLRDNNILVVYRDKPKTNKFCYFECIFEMRNFHHLTGTKISKGYDVKIFYDKCLNKRLTIDEFELSDDGTTYLKKDVLEKSMQIQHMAKMVGIYNNNKPRLMTDKLVGNINCCVGFVKRDSGYYVPNTVLKTDIRDEIIESKQITAIYMKTKNEEKYNRMCYLAKGISPKEVIWNKKIESKIDKENLKHS